MKLREFNFATDAGPIDEIFRVQPELGVPSLNHVFDNAVAVNGDERPLAYGVLKSFAEAVLIINRSETRKREKAEIIKLVVNRAITTCKFQGIEKLIIITDDESYARVLKNRWNFKNVEGQVLFLEID